MKTRLFLILSFTFLICKTSFAQISATQIDSLMVKALKDFNVAGASIAVVKDGKVIIEKGYGVKSVKTKEPVDQYTDFQIASNSKAFTSAALSILVDEGKISWKDKVKKYIPEFTMYNDYVTQNFLVEDLLSHRSGLGLGAGDLMQFPDGSDFTMKDVLNNFQYFKPVSEFRTEFAYDNQLYFVAGELIKRIIGLTWEEFIKNRIFKPLEMNHSYPSLSYVKDFSNIAIPHTATKDQIKSLEFSDFDKNFNGAAGGILSNAHDMAKWMNVQLHKGKYGISNEKALFSEARQKEMWKIHTVMDFKSNPRYRQHFSGYGLGWFISDINGNLWAQHTGGLDGMLSIVRLVPDQKLGIVILTNTDLGGIDLCYAVTNAILDNMLNVKPTEDWIGKYVKRMNSTAGNAEMVVAAVWKKVDNNKKTRIDYSNYIGIYEDKWFGKAEVFMKGNQLWFKSYRSPKLNGAMHFYQANTFAVKWGFQEMEPDAFAIFSLDEEGKAKNITMKGISPNMDFSYDFQDLDFARVEWEKK